MRVPNGQAYKGHEGGREVEDVRKAIDWPNSQVLDYCSYWAYAKEGRMDKRRWGKAKLGME